MTKFKLIKNYPDSHKELGDVIEFCTNCTEIISPNKDGSEHFYSLHDCLLYDEHWEKVIEKGYEILSYYNPNVSNLIYEKNHPSSTQINWYSSSQNAYITVSLACSSSIHSVKRLSDNEIFTVCDYTIEGKISAFDEPGIECLYKVDNSGKGWRMLSNAVKKLKLFTTEDGVKIFEGDEYWYVNKVSSYILRVVKTIARKEDIYSASCVDFSTKEKAEEYAAANKALFRTYDGVDIFKNDSAVPVDPLTFKIYTVTIYTTGNSISKAFIYFSTQQKAEEYVSANNSKPLLKTEDGVDIFVGDHYYRLNKDYWSVAKLTMQSVFSNSYRDVLFFSTKEKAKEYFLMNKPCLSVNDIYSICTTDVSNSPFGLTGIFNDRLIKLANSKL